MKRTPLKPGGPLKRKTPIRKRNAERLKRVRGDEVYGSYHRAVAERPCVAAHMGGCLGPVAGHHLKSVGAGGKDYGNEVAACTYHHGLIHSWGLSRFEDFTGVTLHLEAARLAKEWEER